ASAALDLRVVLQESLKRVGDDERVRVDVRLLAANRYRLLAALVVLLGQEYRIDIARRPSSLVENPEAAEQRGRPTAQSAIAILEARGAVIVAVEDQADVRFFRLAAVLGRIDENPACFPGRARGARLLDLCKKRLGGFAADGLRLLGEHRGGQGETRRAD